MVASGPFLPVGDVLHPQSQITEALGLPGPRELGGGGGVECSPLRSERAAVNFNASKAFS